MGSSRTKNSARNMGVAILFRVVTLVFSFVCRTVFIEILGSEYLGINGLFTNILRLLSFAELGAGSAIIYKMYKPIAENDTEKIKSLLHLYRRAYNIIGVAIFVMGIALIPFLPFLMKDTAGLSEDKIILYYILFLANSSISYFFVYKRSLLTAYQDEYVVNLISLFATVLTNILEIIFLFVTHNYATYLLMQICGTLFENILIAFRANKRYPYIKDKTYQKLSKYEHKSFFRDVKVLFLYQVANAMSLGTDNIIISALVGVNEVGLISNYTLITTSLFGVIDTMFNAITPSIGNLNTIKDKTRKEKVFYQILYMLFIVYGYASIMITLLINKFIVLWVGEDYVFNMAISIVLGLDLFVSGMRYVYYSFRNTSKLFRKKVLLPFTSVLANVLLSILLANVLPVEGHWKVFGVLFATPFTKLAINLMYEPSMIHKYIFGSSPLKYYKKYGYYMFVTVLAGAIGYFVINALPVEGIVGFVIDGVLGTLIVAAIFWLFTFKTTPYREVKKKLIRLVKRKV